MYWAITSALITWSCARFTARQIGALFTYRTSRGFWPWD